MPEVVVGVTRLDPTGARIPPEVADANRDEGAAVYAHWMRFGDAVITANDGLKSVQTAVGNHVMEVTVTLIVSGMRTVDKDGDEAPPKKGDE